MSAGEPSLTELRAIAMVGAAKYGHQDEGMRALFTAGERRGIERAIEEISSRPIGKMVASARQQIIALLESLR